MIFGSGDLIEQYALRISELTKLYEARISDLNAQIEDLKKLAYSPTSATDIPLVAREADAIISLKEEITEIDPEELSEGDKIISEANRIFAGTYEEFPE